MSLPVTGWFLSDDRWFAPIPESLRQENETVKSPLRARLTFSLTAERYHLGYETYQAAFCCHVLQACLPWLLLSHLVCVSLT